MYLMGIYLSGCMLEAELKKSESQIKSIYDYN